MQAFIECCLADAFVYTSGNPVHSSGIVAWGGVAPCSAQGKASNAASAAHQLDEHLKIVTARRHALTSGQFSPYGICASLALRSLRFMEAKL